MRLDSTIFWYSNQRINCTYYTLWRRHAVGFYVFAACTWMHVFVYLCRDQKKMSGVLLLSTLLLWGFLREPEVGHLAKFSGLWALVMNLSLIPDGGVTDKHNHCTSLNSIAMINIMAKSHLRKKWFVCLKHLRSQSFLEERKGWKSREKHGDQKWRKDSGEVVFCGFRFHANWRYTRSGHIIHYWRKCSRYLLADQTDGRIFSNKVISF